ncbi:unnamed protein product, partial [Coregonus sp. 'balchen']
IIECQGLPLISGQNCDPYATVSLVGPARSDQKKTKVTRPNSYTKKSHFQVEEEDIEKLEIKYLLQPKGNGKSKTDDLGSLRLNVTYTEDNVLPSACYTPLRTLLLKSPDIKPISASAAHILGDICRERYEAVLPVVRLLLHHNRLVPFVSAIVALELENTQEANTIFRGNSLATRCIDDMMKIVGRSYLTVTLKPVLDEENLQGYVQKVFSSITQSSSSCPPLMCDVFRSLRHMASKRFPDDPHVQYSAVSSFVFLRFFAVAVLSPHTFQLRPHHPTIQTLGSWGSLSKNKLFLDEISSNVSKESSGVEDSVVLKEGEVQKRAQGRKRIGKRTFKKRWLRVTNRELSYHKH